MTPETLFFAGLASIATGSIFGDFLATHDHSNTDLFYWVDGIAVFGLQYGGLIASIVGIVRMIL